MPATILLRQGTESAPAPPAGSPLTSLFPIAAIFAIFYFLLIRPERKRQRQRQQMIKAVKKSDRVVTTGGLHGVVAALDDRTVVLKVDENVRLRFNRDAIASVLERDEDAREAGRAGSG